MKPITTADIMAFEPYDGDDQAMVVDHLMEVLKNSGFEVGPTNISDIFYFEIEVPFEKGESLIYPIYFWVDSYSMLFMDIRVAGEQDNQLQSRYFKTMDYLRNTFQTGIEVNKNHGQCYWSWKGIPLHPTTITDTVKRILDVVQYQLSCYYEVFCLMDDHASDDDVLAKAKVINEIMSSRLESDYYM